MFSPEASLQSARSSLRGTRRRQRDSNGHDQPRRKRSKIAEDGASQTTAGADLKANGTAAMNGHADHSAENSLVLVDMPVREKKAPPKRALKEDSAQYLVSVEPMLGGSQLIKIAMRRPKTEITASGSCPASLLLLPTRRLLSQLPQSRRQDLRSRSRPIGPSCGITAAQRAPRKSSLSRYPLD